MFEELTGRTRAHLISYNEQFLVHKDSLKALYSIEHAGVKAGFKPALVSSFRDFERQCLIWNKKWSGERAVLDCHGHEINIKAMDTESLAHAIMRWSAVPGASRHHWGSDFDFFDERVASRDQVCLLPSESEKGGLFYEFHQWLDEYLSSGENPGFFRPYSCDNGGVAPERWHLSHGPVAGNYFRNYTHDVLMKNLGDQEILGRDYLLDHSMDILSRYILNITLNK